MVVSCPLLSGRAVQSELNTSQCHLCRGTQPKPPAGGEDASTCAQCADGVDPEGGAATDCDRKDPDGQPDPKRQKKASSGKVERRKALFKGYDEEKASYSTIAVALQEKGHGAAHHSPR